MTRPGPRKCNPISRLAPGLLLAGILLQPAELQGQGVDLRIVDETAPPGGLAVILVELTEPKPISSGQLRFSYGGSFLGSPQRAAVLHSASVTSQVTLQPDGAVVDFASADASYGTEPDLPIMIFAIPVDPGAQVGQSTPITLDLANSIFLDPQGFPYPEEIKPGTLTVGGYSANSMTPFQGNLQAGQTITFQGIGFPASLDINISEADIDQVLVDSSTQVRVRLGASFTLQPTTRIRFRDADDKEDFLYPAVFQTQQSTSDLDGDGVDDIVEEGAPNGGDGNQDQIADRVQAGVASLPSTGGMGYITLVSSAGEVLRGVETEPQIPAGLPAEVTLPLGLVRARVSGVSGTTSVRLLLPEAIGPGAFYRFGPRPDVASPGWYPFQSGGNPGVGLLQDEVVLRFADGAAGDDDRQANGSISFLGGPAQVERHLYFPHFVAGTAPDTGTRFVLRNTSNVAISGGLQFADNSGVGQPVELAGISATRHSFQVSPWGTLAVSTSGNGGLISGIVDIVVESGPGERLEASEVFTVLGRHVSVNQDRPRFSHQLFISVDGDSLLGEDSGLAIFNPHQSAAAHLSMTLIGEEGAVAAQRQDLEVGPRQQLIGFVSEEFLFAQFFDQQVEPFVGTLHIEVTLGPEIVVLGLIQKSADAALIAIPASPNTFPGN